MKKIKHFVLQMGNLANGNIYFPSAPEVFP